MNKTLIASLLALQSMVALAACPSTPGRFVANGAEVTDTRTGLIWQRCSAGQSWRGSTCKGRVGKYTPEQALAYAKTQNTTDSVTGWRLPNVKELSSLADRGCQKPAIDSTVFPPATMSDYWYETSSPFVNHSGTAWEAWGVDFYAGRVGAAPSAPSGGAVRLVRSSQ